MSAHVLYMSRSTSAPTHTATLLLPNTLHPSTPCHVGPTQNSSPVSKSRHAKTTQRRTKRAVCALPTASTTQARVLFRARRARAHAHARTRWWQAIARQGWLCGPELHHSPTSAVRCSLSHPKCHSRPKRGGQQSSLILGVFTRYAGATGATSGRVCGKGARTRTCEASKTHTGAPLSSAWACVRLFVRLRLRTCAWHVRPSFVMMLVHTAAHASVVGAWAGSSLHL